MPANIDTRIFRYVIALLYLALSSVASAANDKATEPVTAGTYEHDPGLSDAYIGLKNNTNYAIKSLSFQISYFDMDGNQLDYEDFNIHTAIEPGLAKKIKIPANEPLRQSWYMRDFKIKFRLKAVNGKAVNGSWRSPSKDKDIEPAQDIKPTYSVTTSAVSTDNTPEPTQNTHGHDFGDFIAMRLGITMVILLLSIIVALYVLVAQLAKRYNRSAVLWLIISLVITPVLAVIILHCIGTRNPPHT